MISMEKELREFRRAVDVLGIVVAVYAVVTLIGSGFILWRLFLQ